MRRAAFALVAWVIVSFASIPAVAQELPEAVDQVTQTIPTPTPSLDETLGTVNDTVKSINDKNLPGSGGDGGSPATNQDPGSGGSGGSSNGGGAGAGGSGSSQSITTKKGSRGSSDPETSAGSAAEEPYASLAARGTVAAAGRALKLAGPLAPALGLAIVALIVVFGLSRGSSRLVKLDEGRFPEQTYRL